MKKIFLKKTLLAAVLSFSIVLNGYCFTPKDTEYKKALIKDSNRPEYTLKNMKSIMGEKELTYVIKRYDKHPECYTSDISTPKDQKGVKALTYRAGLHAHTVFSDGQLTPKEMLDQAADYANKVKAEHPFEKYPIIIAFTDHYNTQGAQEAIDIIQKNPQKYKNVKVVLGMETTARVNLPSQAEERDLHLLILALNPYSWPFDDMNFDDADWGNNGEYKELNFLPDFRTFIKRAQALKYGIVGIAHPLRYFDKDETTTRVISELFDEFANLKEDKIIFTEGYYQPYKFETPEYLYEFTSQAAAKRGIYRTGSQDSHGKTIFHNFN